MDLCAPFLKTWGKAHEKTLTWIWKFHREIFIECFGEIPNRGLWFCGFSVILIPLVVSYFAFLLAIQIIVATIFIIFGLMLGMSFVLIGIWPAFIISIGATGISIITLPKNIYYHLMITYRTVMLRRMLKTLSFTILPFLHFFIPPVIFITGLVILLPWFCAVSFSGHPGTPWIKIKEIFTLVWNKFTKDAEQFAENYGHWSGIPENWDGTIYGMAIDPIIIILSLFLYVIAIILISPVVFVIFIIKSIPIFLLH